MEGDDLVTCLTLCRFCSLVVFQVSLGTVTNVDEGVKWLSYTYLFVRMRNNPLVYGLKNSSVQVYFITHGFRNTFTWCRNVFYAS